MKRKIYRLCLLLSVNSLTTVHAQNNSKAEAALNLLMEGNFVQAKQSATQILSSDNNNSLALAIEAGGLQFENNLTAAQADLEKAIRLNPGNGVYQALLADCYRIAGNSNGSNQAAQKAIPLLSSPRSGIEYFALGIAMEATGKQEAALTDYSRAIETAPRYVRAYGKRAGIYLKMNNADAALADYSKAISINPGYLYPYFSRGNIYLDKQKYELAIADYTSAINGNLKDEDAYVNRGVAYRKLEKPDLALADYNKALELMPKDIDAINNRGNIYYGRQQYDLALADYNNSISINPGHARSYYLRANVYAQKQQPDQAVTDYTKAIALNPQMTDAYLERGNAWYNNKKYDLAAQDFNQALAIDPHSSTAWLRLGFIHHDKEEFKEAITAYSKAIELDPNSLYAYNNRAEAYEAIGDSKQANLDRKKYSDLGGQLSASGSNGMKSIFPSGTFDAAMAQNGLSRGLSTIQGIACSKYDGLRFDAAGATVLLYPATPYLEEWYNLREKKESKTTAVYMSKEANKYHIEAIADNQGRFVFEGLKPGKYFIQVIHSFNQQKTATVYSGSSGNTDYYYHQDYVVGRSARFEKFVEIKDDGETKKIVLTSGLIKSCKL